MGDDQHRELLDLINSVKGQGADKLLCQRAIHQGAASKEIAASGAHGPHPRQFPRLTFPRHQVYDVIVCMDIW